MSVPKRPFLTGVKERFKKAKDNFSPSHRGHRDGSDLSTAFPKTAALTNGSNTLVSEPKDAFRRTSAPQPPTEGTASPPLPEQIISQLQSPSADTLPSSHYSALQTTGKIVLKSMQVLKETLDGVPDMGILQGTLGGILKIVEIVQQKSDVETALKDLDESIIRLVRSVLAPLKGRRDRELPPELYMLLVDFKDGIERILIRKNVLESEDFFHKVLDAAENKEIIIDLKSKIGSLLQESILRAQFATTLSSYDEKVKRLVQSLPIISAAYQQRLPRDRTENTSAKVVNAINEWIDNDSDPNIMILHGLAGVGKSTVAQAIADSFSTGAGKQGRLGAKFFFTRNRADKLMDVFPTIAWQLAQADASYFHHLIGYLDSLLRREDETLEDQVGKMIIMPPPELPTYPSSRVLIVIDALDEFDDAGATALLKQLITMVPIIRFKVLITCRLEPHLKTALGIVRDVLPDNSTAFKLQDMLEHIDTNDIRDFILSELSVQKIEDEFPDSTWSASELDYNVLADIAGSLFIAAATMVDFIKNTKAADPEGRLRLVLATIGAGGQSKETPYAALDRVYMTILRASLPGDSIDSFLQRYRNVVGSILILQQPLRREALGALIHVSPGQVRGAVKALTSVIHEINQCPQVFHASFTDFLSDPMRCAHAKHPNDPEFYIDIDEHHAHLAELCLDIIHDHLTDSNILGLGDNEWFKDRKNQSITDERIREKIPQQLQYACRYWVVHFSRTSRRGKGLKEKLERFATKDLLFWIEALGWTGDLADALSALTRSQEWSVPDPVHSLLYDGERLLMQYYEIIKNAPLHLYSSAFPFVPSETRLFQLYKEETKRGVEVLRGQAIQWDAVLAVLHGHNEYVTAVSFSPDGKQLASASNDQTIRLWDGVTGKEIATLIGHTDRVNSVAFSPDSQQLASASDDSTVRLWNSATGKEIAVLDGHTNSVTSIAYSPDGKRFASATDRTVYLWDGASGKEIVTLNASTDWISSVAFSPDGKLLASASNDSTIRLWDGVTGKEVATLEGHTDRVSSATFSPDGRRITSASDDHTVRIWDAGIGKGIATMDGHGSWVNSVAFSPNSKLLASASDDCTARLWDGETGKEVATLVGHTDGVNSVTFSPDGERLASASDDRTVRIWDGVTGKKVATLDGHTDRVSFVTFSPDGERLASASIDRTIRLWNNMTEKENTTTDDHTKWVRSVAISPDGKRVASASYDSTIRLWDGITGKNIAILTSHTDSVTCVAFSTDGRQLASGSNDHTVHLWDGVTGQEIVTLDGHTNQINSVTFSPDGERLASASDDHTVCLWDSVAGKKIVILVGHAERVHSVAFSPDGKQLVSTCHDAVVRLWNGVTGKEIAILDDHTSWVTSVVFSPDGGRLASASDDRTIYLWDSVTGKKVATLLGHADRVNSVAFSPNGDQLASASDDCTVRLWDSATGKEIATLSGHTDSVRTVAFSPDGRQLASVTYERIVHIWDAVIEKCTFLCPIAPNMKGDISSLFAQILFLPKTSLADHQCVSLFSIDPLSPDPPLLWLPPWFHAYQWWFLPTGGLFITNKYGKVLIIGPLMHAP